MTDAADRSRFLECPRCGHALDGSVAAAEARSERSVQCTECALESPIAPLSVAAAAPRWFVEARGGGLAPLAVRAFATLVRCLRPWRFWSSVPMSAPISMRGLVALVLALAVVVHLAAAAWRIAQLDSRGREWLADAAWAMMAPVSRFHGSGIVQYATAPDFPDGLTRRGLQRLASTAAEAWWLGVSQLPLVAPPERETIGGNGVVAAYFAPDAPRKGVLIGTTHVWPPPGPLPPDWLPGNMIVLTGSLRPWTANIVARGSLVALIGFGPTLTLLLLPASLRRAKVRARHLVRGCAYALVPMLPVGLLFLRIEPWGAIGPLPRLDDPWMQAILLGMPVMAVWTHAFVARYLRLPHALPVALAACAVPALLALAAALELVPKIR